MHDNAWRLLTLLSMAWLVSGCAHRVERGGFDACAAEGRCTVGGKLQLLPGQPAGAAVLSDRGACVKLALPDEFYMDPLRRQWNGKTVLVEGQAFAQPNNETDVGVLMWYSEQDRKLAMGACDHALGIYVDSMRSSSGRTWPDAR